METKDLKDGDRVIDLMFPHRGPATFRQHPCPETVRDGRDKWLIEYDDKRHATMWIGKYMAHTQVKLIEQ